jgi:hypothetical protein
MVRLGNPTGRDAMRLMHHGELIRGAGHCDSVGCHKLATWKAVYEDKAYSYLCDRHITELSKATQRAKKRRDDYASC